MNTLVIEYEGHIKQILMDHGLSDLIEHMLDSATMLIVLEQSLKKEYSKELDWVYSLYNN